MEKTSSEKSRSRTADTRLIITAGEALVPKFFGLLQSGFALKLAAGSDIKSFLCRQVGLPEDYFAERIQTLFLDGRPVDDAATAQIRDGSRLALSAAMPGVAGALFRKGGRYSAMRKGISYRQQDVMPDEEAGWVTIKLFNLVLKELGPFFLAKGVRLDGKTVLDFFGQAPEGLIENIQQVEINGDIADSAVLSADEWSAGVFLKIVSE
jgi:hypothetical protein